MKPLIISLVSTNGGWITRQLLKYASYGSGSLAVWLADKGVGEDHTKAITAGVVAVAAAAIEQGLSFVARKYAVKQ